MRVLSRHFTKAAAHNACSQHIREAPLAGRSSGHGRVKYQVSRVDSKLAIRRWQVYAR